MRSALERLTDSADVVAPFLLGGLITVATAQGAVTVRISEVEAYLGATDPGSHAFRGRTPRTDPMFGPAGHLYVYFTYGMHWCANVVTGLNGEASACLLRAGDVVDGIGLARARRPGTTHLHALACGPANLARVLGLSGDHSGQRLHVDYISTMSAMASPLLQLRQRSLPRADIETGARVGVSGIGGDGTRFPLRFWIRGQQSVSLYRPHHSRRVKGAPVQG